MDARVYDRRVKDVVLRPLWLGVNGGMGGYMG